MDKPLALDYNTFHSPLAVFGPLRSGLIRVDRFVNNLLRREVCDDSTTRDADTA